MKVWLLIGKAESSSYIKKNYYDSPSQESRRILFVKKHLNVLIAFVGNVNSELFLIYRNCYKFNKVSNSNATKTNSLTCNHVNDEDYTPKVIAAVTVHNQHKFIAQAISMLA